eukprot:scaffold75101_cov63-Cyclotella_meneghiniana.AAC.1
MVEIGIHSLQWSPQADYRVKYNEWSDMVETGIHSLQWSPQADYRDKVGLNLPSVVLDTGTKIVTAG